PLKSPLPPEERAGPILIHGPPPARADRQGYPPSRGMSNVQVRENTHSSFSNARSDVQTRNVAASARISLSDSTRVRQDPARARPYRRSQRTAADSGSPSPIVKMSGSQVSTSMPESGSRNRWLAYRWANSNRPAAMLRATVW